MFRQTHDTMTNTLLVAAIAVIFVQQEMGCVQVKL
jgi:hypothetical protein